MPILTPWDPLVKNAFSPEMKLAVDKFSYVISMSCKTTHPASRNSEAACTSCPEGTHFTVLDPSKNSGVCTKRFCPFCKPSGCCGKNHKHFVINSESLEGVCVRHSDDCTPLCVPYGEDHPSKRRVCTSGCNRVFKKRRALG